MSDHHLLAPYIRRFLVEHVVADRCLSVNTQKSYRDAIRLLICFLSEHSLRYLAMRWRHPVHSGWAERWSAAAVPPERLP